MAHSIQTLFRFAALIVCTICFQSNTAQASPPELGGCGPLLNGAIVNTAPECINDSTFLVVDRTKADDDGWQYSFDSEKDGVSGGSVGGTAFEFYGMAFRETESEFWFVINSNLPITGINLNGAADGNVGHGDLFINLGAHDFLLTSNAGEFFAIRYADSNDSGAPEIGLYSSVSAKSVTGQNLGFNNLGSYINHVNNRGGTVGFGDLPLSQTYYSSAISLNVIASGTPLGPITLVSPTELIDAGFRIDQFPGTSTIGFKIERTQLVDACGVAGGDGSSCADCAGVACGTSVEDQCGECGGDGRSCLDCAGTPFGDQSNDACGVCGGDNSTCADCSGTPNGEAKLDQCGICGGDGTSCLDCAGEPFGNRKIDQCGICDGDGTTCLDCAGTVDGRLKTDDCGVCGGDGKSCLECEETDISKILRALDGHAADQRRVALNALGLLAKLSAGRVSAQKWVRSKRSEVDLNYEASWNASWSFPWIVKECAPSPLCSTVDQGPLKAEYSSLAAVQHTLLKQIVGKLSRAGKNRRRLVRLRRSAKQAYSAAIAELSGIPATTTVCL